ncbi:sugar-binding domain-containing protein [Pedobacter sp. GR22-6]|uniref:sugar-binding domain-containing protein n=1 Tax=Pedobacter sp. GR22-6 TaxID=3127957 RepID=UPI00307FADA8
MKYSYKPFCFTILCSLLFAHAFSQSAKNSNGKTLFDYDWKFQLGDDPKAVEQNFDDSNWRSLNLPHDWSIEGKVDAKNPSGNDGGYFPTGLGWYRKTFTVPADLKGKKVNIYFGGVYMNAEVYINGKKLGIRPYGYSSFFYDLSPHLNYGANNVISVRVDNSAQKSSRWYTGSGIYRHVWLLVNDPVHIAPWDAVVQTMSADVNKAELLLKVKLTNDSPTEQKVLLRSTLLYRSKSKASSAQSISIARGSTKDISQQLQLTNPMLWSPASPAMYQLKIEIFKEGKSLGQQVVPMGIRTLAFNAEQGFLLNGKPIEINGGCVHHDNGSLGAAAYDRAEFRKAEILKAAGFNSVRTSHNPTSEAFLDACDQLGLMVMDESFDGWRTKKTDHDYAKYFDQWWKADVEALVRRDINHPSIIMWSVGNEIIERKEPQAVETAKSLVALVKSIDVSRPVTSAITTWDKDWAIFDPLFAAHDIGGYNYQLHRSTDDHQRVPSRIMVQTESYPRDAFANWKLVRDHKYIIGDYVWTAMDYLGESGIGRFFYEGETKGEHYERDIFPWHGAYCGDIDLLGWRKPISHYRDLLYNEDKKLYMAVREPDGYFGKIKETLWSVWPTWESWSWPGHEGREISVEVYSRYPAVRLYLNGQLVAEKATSEAEQFKVVFTLPYVAGTLKAVGVVDGKEVGQQKLRSAGEIAAIKLKADRKSLDADAQDLAYVQVELVDKDGCIQPNDDRKISFEVVGAGEIIAVDNANLKDTDAYIAKERKSWKGKAMVIIRSKKQSGKLRLKVTADGVESKELTILVKHR